MFGEIRSLEHSEVSAVNGEDLDALAGGLDAPGADVDPEARGLLIDRLCTVSTARIEHVLGSRGWSALGEHVHSYTNHSGHVLVGVYVPDTHTFGEGEVRCFAQWHGGARVYDPALSTHGYFDDDCSSIWVARNARLDSAQEARDWARERAGRAPAYYRLSRQWRFLCSGKTYNKYSDPY